VDDAANFRPGTRIANRYEVLDVLGRGGMAVVYRVRDEHTGELVALKRGWSRNASKLHRYSALLEREYFTLTQLAHPRIIRVYDYGLDNLGPWYTMELLDGEDLQRAGRLPWERACAVLRDVASSLALLHSRGLLHRDVSTRNVRWTADGAYAKLIDFGTMSAMGVPKQIVGTPRFIAPEALVLQSLDARADLFSLGAVGYFLLTGRDAFPARRMAELRDLWRSRPIPPARIVDDIPEAVSALVMRLLSVDRSGRLQSAGEMISHLRTLAHLEIEDSAAMTRAYLSTPALVGRSKALIDVRRRILSLMRADGGVARFDGEAGSGRSRMLDVCALEAKLVGAVVIRLDARDSADGPWSAAHALCRQLISELPSAANETARLSRGVLSQVVDELSDETSQPTTEAPDRSLLIRELRDFVLGIARTKPLLITVDQVEQLDEPTVAVLTSLAHKTARNPVYLAIAAPATGTFTGDVTQQALQTLLDLAEPIQLEPLGAEGTETMLRSLFGESTNLPACAARIHGLTQGNPGAVTELATNLVDSGEARYADGTWLLPGAFDEATLPSSLTNALTRKWAALSSDARDLLAGLVLADGDGLKVTDYVGLTAHRDRARVFVTLDELAAAHIGQLDGDRFYLTQRAFIPAVERQIPAAFSVELHRRIAELSSVRNGGVLRRVHHWIGAGQDKLAIDLLCSVDLSGQIPPVPLLEQAIHRAEALQLSAATLHRLRMALLVAAPFSLASEEFRRVAPIVLHRLEHDCGLARYRELSSLPDPERLSQALAQTHERYLATPEHERVHPVIEAVRELARLSGSVTSLAVGEFDLDLLESLPSLEPLRQLSPAIQIVVRAIEGAKFWVRGDSHAAREAYKDVLERLEQPDHAGLDELQLQRARKGILYSQGLLDGSLGILDAEPIASRMETYRELRVNAWRIRMVLHLALGDPEQARRCSRRAQLLHVQEGLKERYVGTSAGLELFGCMRLRDLAGVRSTMPALERMASCHANWRPVYQLGLSALRQLEQDLEGALAAVQDGLACTVPQRHPFYASLLGQEIHVLTLLGRFDQAAAKARTALDLGPPNSASDLHIHIALALADAGDFARALGLMAEAIATAERLGSRALSLCLLYEARARIALRMADQAAFGAAFARCRAEQNTAKNLGMDALVARLAAEAADYDALSREFAATYQVALEQEPRSQYETINSRIAECVDRPDRARCALTLLLQSTRSSVGYLFGAGSNARLELLAALPNDGMTTEIAAWVEQSTLDLLDERSEATGSVHTGESTAEGGSSSSHRLTNEGHSLQVSLCFDQYGSGGRLAAVLVVDSDSAHHSVPSQELRSQVARELLTYRDVVGWD
jgi:tetratricopeptide (TPR) repeat protein